MAPPELFQGEAHAPLMPVRTYQWTSDDDEVATDAVIVGIGSDGPALSELFRATPSKGIGRADKAVLIS